MTQSDILKYLEKNWKSWYTTKYLNKVFNFINSHTNLTKLCEQGLVEKKERIINNRITYFYRFKKEEKK